MQDDRSRKLSPQPITHRSEGFLVVAHNQEELNKFTNFGDHSTLDNKPYHFLLPILTADHADTTSTVDSKMNQTTSSQHMQLPSIQDNTKRLRKIDDIYTTTDSTAPELLEKIPANSEVVPAIPPTKPTLTEATPLPAIKRRGGVLGLKRTNNNNNKQQS